MNKQSGPYCNCLIYSVNAFSRVLTKMADEEFASSGLSSSYAFLLMSVNRNPGVNPTAIAVELQLTSSTVTRLIEKLEGKGLIERHQRGRSTEVFPTPAGMKLNKEIKESWAALNKKYSSVLGKENVNHLTESINSAKTELE